MTVALTGGAGFLGAHVVRELLSRGERLRLLLRAGGERANLDGLTGLEIVEGDLATGVIPEAFPGNATFLVHLAAVYSEDPAHEETMRAVNVGGTRAVLDAARRSGVSRVLHVSTMGTCAPAAGGRAATEDDRPATGSRTSSYVRSKIEAEEIALGAEGLEVVVANPAAPVGAFDFKPSPTGRRIYQVARGIWPRLLAGAVNHVAARDCARGILLAAERGRPGERYLLGGENLGWREFLDRVAAAAGRPPPRRPFLDRLLRRGLPALGNLAIDDAKARRELGYVSGDLDAAFREAVASFRNRPAARIR
jgi:dihydroflavonol-4-reductase